MELASRTPIHSRKKSGMRAIAKVYLWTMVSLVFQLKLYTITKVLKVMSSHSNKVDYTYTQWNGISNAQSSNVNIVSIFHPYR